MTVQFIVFMLGGYLLGSIPAAYLIAKWRRGIDIRGYGSGNVGASNVSAVVSKRWSIPVTIFDIGKGALAVWVAQQFDLEAYQQIAVGICTIIGHNWPLYLGFKGGRGVFTSLGVIFVLSWKLGLIVLVVSYLFAPFRQLAFGVALALFALPFLSWFLNQPMDIEDKLPITLGFIVLSLLALSRRLIHHRTALSKSVHPVELVFNRILFDRDIRNRKAWITQNLTEEEVIEQSLDQD
jgi:glycerol-3-phosphate acyltransferase PlsY